MRSMANVNVTLGLISAPVKVYAATESGAPGFNQVHVHDDGSAHRVNMPCVCADCGEVVARNMLAKGTARDGQMIVLTEDELSAVQPDSARDFEVQRFVHADEINPITLVSSYFLEPNVKANKKAVEVFVLLRETLAESGKVGIVTYVMRGREHLAVLRPYGKTMVVQNLVFAAELRAPEFAVLDTEVTVKPAEAKLAVQLVEAMTSEFVHAEYIDSYATAVENLIDAKAKGENVTAAEAEAAADVSDLLQALEASIAKHPSKAAPGKRRTRKTAVAA